jgi:protein arginine kinase activator
VALCQICGKNEAKVHFTEIHDNTMSEIHVCERCAKDKGLEQTRQHKMDIADLIATMVDSVTTSDEQRVGRVQCPRCGLLYSAFKETGRLGCAECYVAFQFQLRPLLRRIHGDTRHKGKVPARDGQGPSRSRQIQRLFDELQRAVEREEFERAAELRDEIRRLETEDRGGKPTAAGQP